MTPNAIFQLADASPEVGFENYFRDLVPGMILEFGVAGGNTLRQICKFAPHRQVYGFDWFKGLPEHWHMDSDRVQNAGTFSCLPPDDIASAVLVVGLFQDTLAPFLAAHPAPIAFVHLDCDLYSAAACVLQALAARLRPGAVLVFDELYNYPYADRHEAKALAEFVDATGFSLDCLGHHHSEGAGFRLK